MRQSFNTTSQLTDESQDPQPQPSDSRLKIVRGTYNAPAQFSGEIRTDESGDPPQTQPPQPQSDLRLKNVGPAYTAPALGTEIRTDESGDPTSGIRDSDRRLKVIGQPFRAPRDAGKIIKTEIRTDESGDPTMG